MKYHVLLIGALVCAGAALPEPAAAAIHRTSVTIPVGEYEIRATARGADVSVEGYGSLLVPGKPKLPARIFGIAIPPGAEVIDVSYDSGEGIVLPGTYAVPPTPLPRVIGEEDPGIAAQEQRVYRQNHAAVYGSDDAYPAEVVEVVRRAGYRQYSLVDVRVAPFSYHPRSGRLVLHEQITVHVDYALPGRPAGKARRRMPTTRRPTGATVDLSLCPPSGGRVSQDAERGLDRPGGWIARVVGGGGSCIGWPSRIRKHPTKRPRADRHDGPVECIDPGQENHCFRISGRLHPPELCPA